MSTSRVIAYIDGFNFYHGLRDSDLKDSRWLDYHGMSVSLLKSGQRLEQVRYFTTRVKNNPKRSERQAVYIDALLARGGIKIDYGHFLSKPAHCNKCGNVWQKNEEKKTDVNIAVRLLEDAFDDRFDTAMVVSGDSDLVPPIRVCSAPLSAQARCRRLPSKAEFNPAQTGRFRGVLDLP